MDAKLKPILSKLNDISNVKSSRATSQQGGEGRVFSKVNINNPYQTAPMEKNSDTIHPEKTHWKEKVKDLKEKKTDQKEKEDELNPKLTKEQQAEQAKRDALLDEINTTNAKINSMEAEKKNVEAILVNKKALFPPWSFE
ncbi:unnamed protein product [Lactuca saligna]|uniref:Uncharacterized protein n=1 Tax=Lactuca saligna TaxID=75948 RepID=A0AA35ZY94_LACSI|nr:unnamed protein product [Lactuca saligna]